MKEEKLLSIEEARGYIKSSENIKSSDIKGVHRDYKDIFDIHTIKDGLTGTAYFDEIKTSENLDIKRTQIGINVKPKDLANLKVQLENLDKELEEAREVMKQTGIDRKTWVAYSKSKLDKKQSVNFIRDNNRLLKNIKTNMNDVKKEMLVEQIDIVKSGRDIPHLMLFISDALKLNTQLVLRDKDDNEVYLDCAMKLVNYLEVRKRTLILNTIIKTIENEFTLNKCIGLTAGVTLTNNTKEYLRNYTKPGLYTMVVRVYNNTCKNFKTGRDVINYKTSTTILKVAKQLKLEVIEVDACEYLGVLMVGNLEQIEKMYRYLIKLNILVDNLKLKDRTVIEVRIKERDKVVLHEGYVTK